MDDVIRWRVLSCILIVLVVGMVSTAGAQPVAAPPPSGVSPQAAAPQAAAPAQGAPHPLDADIRKRSSTPRSDASGHQGLQLHLHKAGASE